jgi:rhodanese-related sulfurtransferase
MPTGVQSIDVHTLHDWIEKDEVLLIDVRETHEHAHTHIPAANLQPLSTINGVQLPDAGGRRVVVCCASGARSLMVADRLLAAHYGGVYNLDGGMAAWQIAGYPVAGGGQAESGSLSNIVNRFRNSL